MFLSADLRWPVFSFGVIKGLDEFWVVRRLVEVEAMRPCWEKTDDRKSCVVDGK